MSIALRGIDPRIRAVADNTLAMGKAAGLSVVVTSVRRTWSEQTALYNDFQQCVARGEFGTGVQKPGCVYPANPPGDSAHNYGYAFDSWVPPEQMQQWIKIRQYWGWRVPPNDLIHAEVPNWRKYVQGWLQPTG